jgi:hypothetical protein
MLMLAMSSARVGMQTDADAGYGQCKGGYANRSDAGSGQCKGGYANRC